MKLGIGKKHNNPTSDLMNSLTNQPVADQQTFSNDMSQPDMGMNMDMNVNMGMNVSI